MKIKNKRELVVLDELDKQIIRELTEDATQSYLKVGEKLFTAEGTIRNRCKRLKNIGLLNVVAKLDLNKFGFDISCVIGVKANSEALPNIEKTIAKSPNVLLLARCLDRFDLVSFAVFRNIGECEDFVKNNVNNLPGITLAEAYINGRIIKNSWINDPNIINVL